MDAKKNYYEILQVDENATEDEIRKAYRALVREHHPDVATTTGATAHFRSVQEAYEVLADPDQRRAYNHLREAEGLDKSSAIVLRTTLSHKTLLTNVQKQALYVMVEITPAADLPTARLPLNLCLVLDRSTSMQGVRLQKVKEGTRQIIDLLTDKDSLGIVVFSDRAEVILPSKIGIDKAMAKSIASTIQPSGGTEMLQGLNAGLKELKRNQTADSVNHLILLTDGQTYGDETECLKRAEWAGHNQISLTTMGIGTDWNEKLLDEMATATGESSLFIDSPRKVVEAFKAAVRSMSSVVAREMTMSANASAGIQLKEAIQVSPQIRRLNLQTEKALLGPLATGQGKVLMLEFVVQSHAEPGRTRLARITIDSNIAGATGQRSWEWVDLYADFVAEPPEEAAGIPATIVTALGKLAIYKMQERAMTDLEQGHISSATQRLETMATRLLNLGETELARAALLEAGRLARTGDLSAEGRKKIQYGTRALSVLPTEVNND